MKLSGYPVIALISALFFQAPAAMAQSPEEEEELALAYGDKSTVSIATGAPQPLRRAPAVASVVTAEEIRAMGATDLDQVLETVPGIHVSRAGPYYFSTYSIRGINGNPTNPQVLMLQNGISVNMVYRGDKGEAWGGLPLENIARIEIIRGPGSALYGADAFSGVINIITKTAADTPGTELGARTGSFNSQDVWVQHGGQLGPVALAAYLRLGHTDGIKKIVSVDAQSGRDKAFGTHASLAPGPVSTGYDAVDGSLDAGYGKWRLRAGYKLRDQLGMGSGVANSLDPVGRERSERITSDLSWTDPQFAPHWGLGLNASYLHYAESLNTYYQLSPPGTRFPTGVFPDGFIGQPGRKTEQSTVSGFLTYSGFSGHNLRLGAGHDDNNLYATSTSKNYFLNAAGVPVPTGPLMDYNTIQPHLLPHQRQVNYVLAQDEWNIVQDWTLTLGVRRDHYSDFGSTTNPRLAVVWEAAYNVTAKLLAGRAFRAPSFTEQYGINPAANGNPDLVPETISTIEAAFSWQLRPDTQLNLSVFDYRAQNLIRAVANPATAAGATFRNVGAQKGSGAELEAVWDPSRQLRLTGQYSWQRSIDESSQQDAGYAPHHHLYARADWRFSSNWLASSQLNWVAERKRAAGDLRPDIADYTTLDLTVQTRNGKNRWDFAAGVRNLFNADVREPSLAPGTAIPNDLPMAPRSVNLQAIYRL